MRLHRDKTLDEDTSNRIDEILDKINEVGYDKLTEEEQKTLQNASKYFVNKKR